MWMPTELTLGRSWICVFGMIFIDVIDDVANYLAASRAGSQ